MTPSIESGEEALRARATALWLFLQAQTPMFTLTQSLSAVKALALASTDTPKSVAPRLRQILGRSGVRLKHVNALHAAGRLFGATSAHDASSDGIPKYRLACFGAAELQTFEGLGDAARVITDFCADWQGSRNSRWFKVSASEHEFAVSAPGVSLNTSERYAIPIARLRTAAPNAFTLEDVRRMTEALRRRLEETALAVVEGAAVVESCDELGDIGDSELVVRDEGFGEEEARGNELSCWTELIALAKMNETAIRFEDGSWFIGERRKRWDVSLLAGDGSTPQATSVPLDEAAMRRLFRRFSLAQRIFRGDLRRHELTKSLHSYVGAPETYRIDEVQLSEALREAQTTRETILERIGHSLAEDGVVPQDVFNRIVATLNLTDPGRLIRLPAREELTALADDSFLRPLIPRIDAVRTRIAATVPKAKRQAAEQAANIFEGVLMWLTIGKRNVRLDAPADAYQPGPHFEYANAGQDLIDSLDALGLVAYAGVFPQFKALSDGEREAVGTSHEVQQHLLLDIDVREGAR